MQTWAAQSQPVYTLVARELQACFFKITIPELAFEQQVYLIYLSK